MTQGMMFDDLVSSWLADVAPAAAPPDLHARVVQGVARTSQRGIEPGQTWRRWFGRARLAIAVAAAVIVIVVGAGYRPPADPAVGPPGNPSPSVDPSDGAAPWVFPSGALFHERPLDQFGDYRPVRQLLAVDGIAFSFKVPASRWKPFPRFWDGFLIGKRIDADHGVAGLIFWAAIPGAEHATACLGAMRSGATTALGVASAVASAPGTSLERPPTEVTVGGRPAVRVSIVVRDGTGCGPGFVYTWDPQANAAAWAGPAPGDTIDAWVVDVDGRLLFIGAIVSGAAFADADRPKLEPEIDAIVGSLRFE